MQKQKRYDKINNIILGKSRIVPMKKNFREKVMSKSKGIIKKHTFLKIPMMLVTTAILSVYFLCMNIAHNGKRYTTLCMSVLFFVICSSFNFHRTTPFFEISEEEQIAMSSGVQLMAEQGVDSQFVDIIDDSELLENYDDVELVGTDNLDTYTLDDILEENSNYRDAEKNTEDVISQSIDFSKDDWRIILVNKQHPIPEEYTFPLGTIKGNLKCDERIIEDLLDMMQAAKEDQIDLIICSPYRDYNRQTVLFNKKIVNYMSKGLSYMDAYKISSQSVTAPNASEHQVGLAIDFYSSTYTNLNAGFGETETGKWLAEHAYEYGFILRYPLNKEYITGIEFEPWHFRYVGVQAATVITENNITLEEFWEDYLE